MARVPPFSSLKGQVMVTLDSAIGTEMKESAHLLIRPSANSETYCLCWDTHPKLPGLTPEFDLQDLVEGED